MLWENKIQMWENNIYLLYPTNIKNRFFYETSICDKKMQNDYKEIFIEDDRLNTIKCDYTIFKKYLNKSNNKYAVSFYNLSKESLLIIPMFRKNKDFTTIKDFMDNASILHQKKFWNFVELEIKTFLKKNDFCYVSTHGLGVPYFHLRLDKIPKYYVSELK